MIAATPWYVGFAWVMGICILWLAWGALNTWHDKH